MREPRSLRRQGGWTTIIAYIVEYAIAFAVGYAINAIFGPKKSDPRIISPKYSDNQEMVRSAVEPHKIVYGRSVISGPLVFAATNGPGNQNLHVVVPFTGHEVDEIEAVYFDDIDSTGPEYNKIEKWQVVGYAVRGNVLWWATLAVDGVKYGGAATSDYQGNHSRIKTTEDVIYYIWQCILADQNYSTKPWTVVRPHIHVLEFTAKQLGDEFTITNVVAAGGTTGCGLTSPGTRYPGENDLAITRVQKAHIFDLYKHTGHPDQVADANLVAESVGWTSNHRLRGRSYVYAKLAYYADRWPTGIPVIKAKIRGRKVFDPRSSTTYWTDNAALCIRDYLTSSFGLGCSAAEINDTAFIAAANLCDEYVLASTPISISTSAVGNPGPVHTTTPHKLRTGDSVQIASHTGSTPSINGTHTVTVVDADTVSIPVNITVGGTGGTIQLRQKRYTCNGAIALGEKPIDVIQKLLTACDGVLVYSEGKYSLYPGASSAAVGDLNASHLRGGLKVVARPPRRNIFNSVRGTFVDAHNFWQETDFPSYDNATYQTQDGGVLIQRDISLPFTTDVFEAQRRAKQILERSRQGTIVVFPAKLSAFKYAVNDVVRLTISYMGWVNKEFRILNWSLTEDMGVDITLQEEAAASYAWNNGDETILDPAPNTTLPSAFTISTPTGLTLTEELYQATNTGGVRSRIRATWTASADPTLQGYVLTLRAFSDHEQAFHNVADQVSPIVVGNTYHFEDLAPGYYYVSIHAINNIGVSSPESASVEIILVGNTIPPADVTGFVAYQNKDVVVFAWNPVSDVDLRGYEIRYGPTGSVAWDSANPLTIAERGSEVTSALIAPGTWTFFIKAQDTSDIYSTNAASDSLIVTGVSTTVKNIYQNPDWLGTKTGFVEHWTGKLFPDDQNLASSYTNFEWCDTFVPTPVASCSYESPEIDCTFDDVLRAWAVVDGVLGPGVAGGTLDFPKLIDTKLDGGSYGGFLPLLIGFEEGRYFKFKFTHDPAIGKAVITQFQTVLDKAQVTDAQSDVPVAAAGTTVTFQLPFHNKPLVTATVVGSTAAYVSVYNVTTTGFTAKVYNSSGTAIDGTINYTAIGV